MWFKILYFVFVILAYIFPTVPLVGPISIRHAVMVLMLLVCINKGVRWDKYMTLFSVFLFFFGISSIITGFAVPFVNKLVGTYLQAYVMFFATYLLIKQYNGEVWLVNFFLMFGLLDAFVTIGQFYNMSFAQNIVDFLGIDFEEEYLSKMERYDIMEGVALQGLVGSVRNGYFLSAIAVLALYNKKGKIALYNWAIWMIVMVASLLEQERMGFYVAVLLSFVVIVSTFSVRMKKVGWFFSVVLVFAALLILPLGMDMLQGSNLRYAKELNLGGERGTLAKIGWDYFKSSPMGAYFEYEAHGFPYPHNVFVNMFLVGGVFGVIKYLYQSIHIRNLTLPFFWGLMFLAYTLNSLTHNASIVFGTFEFFVFWNAMIALRAKEIIQEE